VILFYERALHQAVSEQWVARCSAQIGDALTALEADIAAACALHFLQEAHPDLFDAQRWPRGAFRHVRGAGVFREVSQPFKPPA
jgi:glutathione S-transferase